MTLTPRMKDLLERVTLCSPMARALGLELVQATRDLTVLRLPFRHGNITFEDVVHGGAIATLIDVAAAAGFVAGADEDLAGGVTSTMFISYLSAARGCDLLAEARPLRRGRSQTTCDVTVLDPSGRMVAKGTVTSRGFVAPAGGSGPVMS